MVLLTMTLFMWGCGEEVSEDVQGNGSDTEVDATNANEPGSGEGDGQTLEADASDLNEDGAQPEEDATEPEEDTTEPEEDTTEPEEDTTEPEEDTTEPEELPEVPPVSAECTLEGDYTINNADDLANQPARLSARGCLSSHGWPGHHIFQTKK